jgi:hypothetical protein
MTHSQINTSETSMSVASTEARLDPTGIAVRAHFLFSMARDLCAGTKMLAAVMTLALASSGIWASEPSQMSPGSVHCGKVMIIKYAAERPQLADRVLHGRALLSRNTPGAIEVLKAAADAGSDEANYRLGEIYMHNGANIADRDVAYHYLAQVKGRYSHAASVLIGAIHAEGTKTLPRNMSLTRKSYHALHGCLLDELEQLKLASKVGGSEYTDMALVFMEASQLLQAYATKYEIVLP